MGEFFLAALLILVVIALFNFIIFFHELGHFLAARWRGVHVDRFQIWFGKPIWKKEYNGVQYGLGWLPFGGFVALPQMAPMESIEGGNSEGRNLPKIKPLDKIIVAFAGPLFSLLLALLTSLIVWQAGKPTDAIVSTVVGGVVKNSPAEKAGILPGDKILEVNGAPVIWFAGDFEAITERIMLNEGDTISFKIERDVKVLDEEIISKFEIAETPFYQRRALPKVGISYSGPLIVKALSEGENESPADRAGIEAGDQITELDGEAIYGPMHFSSLLEKKGSAEVMLTVLRSGETLKIPITPLVPLEPKSLGRPMLGIVWDMDKIFSTIFTNPLPFEQIGDSFNNMAVTLKAVTSSTSNVGVDQLAGPVGIAKAKFQLLSSPNGWLKVLWFFVFFNVNLAVLNMLPRPVLDGGHIVLASGELIFRRPMEGRVLEVIQTVFALTLISFMLFITTKDIGDSIPSGSSGGEDARLVWPPPAE